jgi:arylsulfatase A-like enzyme
VQKRLLDQRWPWLVAAGAIVVAFLATFIEIRPPGSYDPRPRGSASDIEALRSRTDTNVLFILVDMLRADRLHSYGHDRETSPSIDRLAAGGIRFAHQISQSSWTKASMASLWSALNPPRSGITRFDQVIPESAVMPAEVLAQAGFQTVGLYRNGWVAPTFGFGQGYQVYKHPPADPLPPDVKMANPTLTEQGSDDGTVDAALEFLRINGHKRWFLYLHFMDVHEYLYDEDSALFGTSHVDIYDNSVHHVDSIIGTLLESLAAEGFASNTIVAIAADHGEAFGERGFDGHAREVFRETTEVPFVLSFPFRLDPGLTMTARTRNIDVWPTLLDLVGLALPGDRDGRSLVPEIVALARGEELHETAPTAIAHLDQAWGRPDMQPLPTVAVVDDDHRYVRMAQGDDVIEELFDRRDDPAELHDRSKDQPEDLARMRAVAEHQLELKPAWGDTPKRELNEIELNQLRALGYAVP